MTGLADTLARLAKARSAASTGVDGRLTDLPSFGADPGSLRARIYIPADLPPGAALVTVLHGCTQTAAGYDHGSGWSRLADEMGFALLFPEQRRTNNPNLCFNWFQPGDTARGQGEAASILQMIATMVGSQAIDPARIFITGLSAGGAMTAAMLAAYPELFAGGAVIAGLAYGVAATVPEALHGMRGQGLPSTAALIDRVRGASDHAGPWPTLSVWHGDADATVDPANADALLAVWRGLHGLAAEATDADVIDGQTHRLWRDANGRPLLEDYRIAGMGHGTPLATSGADACGMAGAHMLEAGISSTRHIARFWGLDQGALATPVSKSPAPSGNGLSIPAIADRPPGRDWHSLGDPAAASRPAAAGVAKVIEQALRAAGLMK